MTFPVTLAFPPPQPASASSTAATGMARRHAENSEAARIGDVGPVAGGQHVHDRLGAVRNESHGAVPEDEIGAVLVVAPEVIEIARVGRPAGAVNILVLPDLVAGDAGVVRGERT